MDDLKKLIREVPDYPKPGILFYDLTTLLKDKAGFHALIDRLCDHYKGRTIDVVAGIERRGVTFAPAVAYRVGGGLRPLAQPQEIPAKTAHHPLPAPLRPAHTQDPVVEVTPAPRGA